MSDTFDIGFLIELGVLIFATYLYLYSSGIIQPKSNAGKKHQDEFIRDNNRLVRIMALALMAFMSLNILLRFF